MIISIAFWIMAIVGVIAAIAVVTLRSIFRAALALIVCFLMVAGIYILLNADFLAAIQVLIYVGGISVLIILAIMMTRDSQTGSTSNQQTGLVAVVAIVLLGLISYTLVSTPWAISAVAPPQTTAATLADRLLGQGGFILPVEIAAALLLAAIVGAIVLMREK